MVGRLRDEPIGKYWAETPERSFIAVRSVKDVVKKIPVWVKFLFDTVGRNPKVILKMEEAGADALVPTLGISGALAINLENGKPVLGNPRGMGTVAGHAMKPVGIKCVAELSKIVQTPVIASGGVFSGLDVIEYLMVGAQAVEVLTAIMLKVNVLDMLAGIEKFMSDKGYDSCQAFQGKALEFLSL
jgi:dihydroorotate dehydrogenase (NAD+) catalytic subunit